MKVRCDGSCGCTGEIVELTWKEEQAREEIDGLIGRGYSLQAAVNRVRSFVGFGRVSKDFWTWQLGAKARDLLGSYKGGGE